MWRRQREEEGREGGGGEGRKAGRHGERKGRREGRDKMHSRDIFIWRLEPSAKETLVLKRTGMAQHQLRCESGRFKESREKQPK